jgi:hypothetical protein
MAPATLAARACDSLLTFKGYTMYKDFHKGLSAFAGIYNIDITPLTRRWSEIYKRRYKHRGKADSVKFMKELLTVAERYALYQPIEPIPWTKSNKDGFPNVLNPFKKELRHKDHKHVIMALSVMRSCECLRLPISKDLDTVISPPKGQDRNTLKSIIDFTPKFVKSIKRLTLPEMEYHPTTKNGPNGPALWTSDNDIRSIIEQPHLLAAIRRVEEKLKDKYPMEIPPENESSQKKYIHSKITQFPEKSGKTRTIAIIDYYSQRSLKPLHEGLMKILESLVSDGTNSHINVGKYAAEKCKNKSYIYCADLSAATDRFPKRIQRALLFHLLRDNDLASAFWTLLTERQFTVAWSGEQVTYNCGQPMGCYSSWPLFALAHHLVVEYCAHCAGVPPEKVKHVYRVIGDDVIITEEKTAQFYKEVMPSLGMTINLGKTVESLPSHLHSCAEVAKQLYLDNNCVSPLTPGIIKDLGKPYMFNTCIKVLNEKYDFISPEVTSMLVRVLYPKIKDFKRVWLMISNPLDGFIKPGNPGYDDNSPWIGIDEEVVRNLFRDFVIGSLIDSSISYSSDIFRQYRKTGDPWIGQSCPQPTALIKVTDNFKKKLYDLVQKFEYAFDLDVETIKEEIAYIPDPIQPYRTRRELKTQRFSNMVEQIYDQIKMWEE